MPNSWFARVKTPEFSPIESLPQVDIIEITNELFKLSKIKDVVNDIHQMHVGSDGHTYVVETSCTKYILKIWRCKPIEEIKYENFLLSMLKTKGFPSTGPYLAITRYQRISVASLRYFIEGVELKKVNSSIVRQIGRLLASLHLMTSNQRVPGSIRRFILPDLSFCKELDDRKKIYKQAIYLLKFHFKKLSWNNFQKAIIHDDIKPSNILTNKSIRLTITDWSDAHEDFCVADIGAAIFQLRIPDNMIDIFVRSYTKKKTLSEAEIQALPYIVIRRIMFLIWYEQTCLEATSNTIKQRQHNHLIAQLKRELIRNMYDKI